jgi:hypothetical protein
VQQPASQQQGMAMGDGELMTVKLHDRQWMEEDSAASYVGQMICLLNLACVRDECSVSLSQRMPIETAVGISGTTC